MIIGVIAPALELKQGIKGREEKVEHTRESEVLISQLGKCIGEQKNLTLALGAQFGLQQTCRESYLLASNNRKHLEFSFYESLAEAQNNGASFDIYSETYFIGAGKESLKNYEHMIETCDAVIFAGGFYRAVAAALMVLHTKQKYLGILLGAGDTPEAFLNFLDRMGLPDSAKNRLVVSKNPQELVKKLVL